MKKASLFLAMAVCSVSVFAQSETKMEAKGAHGAKMEKKTEVKADGTAKMKAEHKGGKGTHEKMKKEVKSSM
ncbi:hypothetical protein [Hymenobacter sp. GOD-10R]|uniref:hypothetical protein n=1 Tax=Hymenobacter sp. GOD-10R TaxID=3093922 RepID=UPI002D776B13|nr:hypothetical protein [Hymenobacter sp. GOD-10R]WRQ29813.1 hypothetical protein SD425_05980 [Hymenobacter sp. GOD-10R]